MWNQLGRGGCQSDHSGSLSDNIRNYRRQFSGKSACDRPLPSRGESEITSWPVIASQSSGTANTGQFWRDEARRAGNATLDLSLHASGFSLYVRGVAFGQRLRLFPGRVCLLIKGFFNRTRPLIGWATLPWLQRSLACSQHEWQHDVPPDANMNNSWRKLS